MSAQDHGTLNRQTVHALALITQAASDGARVRWADGDSVRDGTARHLVRDADTLAFLGAADDVRDAYLRVTMDSGTEVCLPVRDVIAMVHSGDLAIR